MKNIQFKTDESDNQFLKTLRIRVNDYFKINNIKKTGNKTSQVKALFLLTVYLTAFVAIFFSTSLLQMYICYSIVGILTIFVALNIAHDAAHGTFSDKKWINNIMLYTFDFLGASGYMWKLKHVHSHHPHVNIPNMDGDIKQSNLVRIFPNSPFLKFHKYQYLYMPFLYAFYTLIWLCIRDFRDYYQTDISGKSDIKHSWLEYAKLFLGKFIFFGRMLLLPYLLLSFSFGEIFLGFFIFHVSASYTVALALISAHVGEHSVYPEPNANGQMKNSWVRHQIITTCDFATDNKVITHLFGAFNHHVIHHVFPNICHIHYPKLTGILIETCKEFDMPYYCTPSLSGAVKSHLKFLKIRSEQEVLVPYLEDM